MSSVSKYSAEAVVLLSSCQSSFLAAQRLHISSPKTSLYRGRVSTDEQPSHAAGFKDTKEEEEEEDADDEEDDDEVDEESTSIVR